MHLGRFLGHLLLSLVDSLLLPVVVLLVGFLLLPPELWSDAYPYLFLLGGVSFVVTLVAAFVSVRRGGKPFPVTRGTKRVAGWLLYWLPYHGI